MKKILIVEDNDLNLKLFCDILEFNNYNVEIAKNGLEAYSKISANLYDLILLDIQLPKMNGFELLDKLKKEKFKTDNFIILSAFAMDCDK